EQQNGCAEHGKNEAAHEVLLSDVGSVRRGWIEAPATGRVFGDHPEVAAAPGKTLRPSALRSNPKHAAVVVVDPHRAAADGEPHRHPAYRQPRDEASRAGVALIHVGRADHGDPYGAEGHREGDRV